MQYVMKEEDANGFASFIGIETKRKGDELIFRYCPYCGSASTPSEDEYKFGLNIKTGACGGFRASCTHKTHFVKMCKDFGYKLPFFNEQQYKQIKQPRGRIQPAESALAYLKNRGISKEIAEQYEVTALNDRPNIMVFPFYNEYGKVEFVKYRNMKYRKGRDKAKEWSESDCKPILFGMKQYASDYRRTDRQFKCCTSRNKECRICSVGCERIHMDSELLGLDRKVRHNSSVR